MNNKPMITVFTPSYNRANLLVQLYNSLCNQTCKDFKWLIVDDGSTDNTKELVESFNCDFEIEYFYQNNKGKYIAHNKGVELCDTELFACVDSDDYLLTDAIEKTLKEWNKYKDNKKCAGLVSVRKYNRWTRLKNPPEYGTLCELHNNRVIRGETFLVFRTEILKQNYFPIIPNEKFVGEIVIYGRIDKNYVMHPQNEYLCAGAYQENGLSDSWKKQQWNNPKGTLLMYRMASAYQPNFKKAVMGYGGYIAWKTMRHLKWEWKEFDDAKFLVKILGSFLLIPFTIKFSIDYKEQIKN